MRDIFDPEVSADVVLGEVADSYKAQGREEGIEIGGEKRAMGIARTMLQEGIEILFIARLTGLSYEQIEALH